MVYEQLCNNYVRTATLTIFVNAAYHAECIVWEESPVVQSHT